MKHKQFIRIRINLLLLIRGLFVKLEFNLIPSFGSLLQNSSSLLGNIF